MFSLSFGQLVRNTISAIILVVLVPSLSLLASTPGGPGGPESQAFGITSNFGKHTGGNITWVYNSTNAPIGWTDDATTAAAFQSAIDEWAGVCNLTFTYNGVDDTADIDDLGDNIVVIEWDAGIGGAAGLAGPASTSATETTLGRYDYVDGTLKMNPNVFEFLGGSVSEQTRNQVSFHAVAVHELGHLIGLGHADDPDAIMYANPYNSITHITDDDRKACRDIYGYADVNDPRATYAPPGAGSNSYDFLFLADFSDVTDTPVTSDDGTSADTEVLGLRWQTTTAPFPKTLTMAVVDPEGFLSTISEFEITVPSGGKFGSATYSLLRENPGTWTIYAYDGTGLVATLPIDVNVALPAFNQPPDATFTFSENPATRAVALNTNVTSDNESNNATIIWHIPGSSPVTVNLGLPPGSDARNVTFTNGLDNEIFVEVNDDHVRYTEDLPNNVGPAGPGFHGLYRYLSSRRDAGPDMDGDNSSDILWRNSSSGKNWLYSVNGNLISSSALINVETDPAWEIVGVADFNGDGKSDILWRNNTTGVNWMYLMNGETIVSSVFVNVESKQDWKVAGTGDFNGDGNSDILWRHDVTGNMYIYFMNGATINTSEFVAQEADSNWTIVGNGDYDGDGMSDILWRHIVSGKNHVYLMNGSTPTSLPINTVGKQSWQVVGSGDYNGDGMSDILWRNYTAVPGSATGRNWVYLMNGNLIMNGLLINHEPKLIWDVVGSGDYNGDGMSDILWRNSANGTNWMYQMDGNTILESVLINKESDSNWGIVNLN